MYRERPSRIRGGFVWSSISTGDLVRVLPDGCIDFLWDGAHISIAGPDTHAQLFSSAAGTTMTGLRFAPGFAPRLLGIPASELTDTRVPLDAVWAGADVDRLTDLVAGRAAPGVALEHIALERLPADDEGAQLTDRVVTFARAGCNSTTIADRVGLSTRQLQRRSTAAFGYGAKTLSRILRMQRALVLARRGERLADSASLVGYADQSHLAREVKEMAGVPITELLR